MTLLRRLSLALSCILLLAGCRAKPDPAAVATDFFQKIGRGEAAKAYQSAAFGFQAQQSQRVFEQTAKEMGLLEFESAAWEPVQYDGRNSAKVRGEVRTKDGTAIPLVVSFARESGEWRVFALRSPRDITTGRIENRFTLVGKGAAFTDALAQPVPDEKTQKQLALDTLLLFNQAIQQRSFVNFYNRISRAWQKQLTEGQLQRAFQPFIDRGVDLSAIREVDVIFNSPAFISTEGLLILNGRYPTKPFATVFQLKFIYELPRWQLFGIDVRLERELSPEELAAERQKLKEERQQKKAEQPE